MTKLDVGGTADRIGMGFFCSFNVPLNDWNVARVYKHGWGDLNDWNVARVLLLYIQRADKEFLRIWFFIFCSLQKLYLIFVLAKR